jgi:hypothetical protein
VTGVILLTCKPIAILYILHSSMSKVDVQHWTDKVREILTAKENGENDILGQYQSFG